MSSKTGSTMPLPEIKRVAVITHGRAETSGEALEQSGEALVVSICAGFSRANIHDVGPSVTVTVDGDTGRGQAIAEEFMDYAWETRGFTTVKLLPVAEAVALAQRGNRRNAARNRELRHIDLAVGRIGGNEIVERSGNADA